MRHSDCRYLTYTQWIGLNAAYEESIWNGIDYFAQIYTKTSVLGSDGTRTDQVINVGVDHDRLMQMYRFHNGDRLIGITWANDDTKDNISINDMNQIIKMTWKENEWKYRHLIQLMGMEYDPISNYDSHEWRHDSNTPNGGIKYDIGARTNTVSGSNTDQPTTKHYETTEDDVAAPGKLVSTDISTGTQNNTSGAAQDATKYDYDLYKKGNIGVMSTQDMMAQELEIAKALNIVEEFFNDVNKRLTLAVYKY